MFVISVYDENSTRNVIIDYLLYWRTIYANYNARVRVTIV